MALVAFAQESVPAQSAEQVQPIQQVQPADGGNIQPLPPQPGEPQKPMPPGDGQFFPPEDNGDDFRDMVEPREIQDALRQMKDVQREIKRVLKKAKKVGFENELSQLNDLSSQVSGFQQKLQGTVDRETMSEFWDTHFWDTFNVIRIKIELPDDVARMEKDMKALDKTISRAKYALEGVDMNAVKSAVEATRGIMAQVRSLLSQGDYEGAQETMQDMWNGDVANPGELRGIVDQTQNIARELRSIKAAAVKQEILDFLAPVIAAINSGDFREANMMLNEVNRDIFRIMNQMRRKSSFDTQMKSKMDQLEQKMMQRLQEEEQKQKNGQAPTSSLMPYRTYRSASLLGNIYSSLLDLLGL